MTNTHQDTDRIELLKEAIAWIENGADFTWIHDVPDWYVRDLVDVWFERTIKNYIDQLAETEYCMSTTRMFAQTLVELTDVAQGRAKWDNHLGPDTRCSLAHDLHQWLTDVLLDDLCTELNELTEADPVA